MQAAFDASDHEAIAHHGSRCRSILIALMTELNPSVDLRLARDLGSLYTFLWQQMAEAKTAEELDDTIEILEQQRDAWRTAVELLQSGPPSPGDGPLDVAG